MKSTITMRRAASSGMLALMLMAARPALAWDGAVSGTIVAYDVTAGHAFALRVFVSGVTNMCGTGSNWAYINEADSNYKTYVAAVMSAKAQGSQVVVYTNIVNGYCQLGYLSVQ